MTQPIEGTLYLEGMIEGRMAPSEEIADRLREWVSFAATVGPRFTLEIDGGHFSLLAEPGAIHVDPPQVDPAPAIRDALNELVRAFEGGPPPRFFSTLRSREYRQQQEVQTVYQIDASGQRFETEQRTVAAQTEAAAVPLTTSQIVRRGLIGVVVALALLGVTSLFIDLPGLWAQVMAAASPIDTDEIVIDTRAFEAYFKVEKVEVTTVSGRQAIVLTVRPVEGYPRTPAERSAAWTAAPDSLEARLPLEAIASGRAFCEMYDKDDVLISAQTIQLRALEKQESEIVRLAISLPPRSRPVRIVIGP